jgi:hypothetical protein
MQPLSSATILFAALAVSACSKDPSSLLGPSGTGPSAPAQVVPGGPSGVSGGGGPAAPSIQPVDTTIFAPSDTGSAGNTGTSTSVMFFNSGAALYGNGTCGPNGTWTDSLGNVVGAHNSHCIAYWSDGRPGSNGKGQCVKSSQGYPGVWLNPGGHATAPYHTQCLVRGKTSSTLTLSFSAQATVYTANDGSGRKVLDFDAGGTTVAQLIYQGTTADYTNGAGVLPASDASAAPWTIDFSQSALNYTSGVTNGDLIDLLTKTGVEVIACQGSAGCWAITLKLTVGP